MSEPFLGQIVMFGGNFAPRSWALCDGQLLPINNYQALFSILGTTYGGDGRTTFALPDLRGRAPIHAGNGPGLSDYRLGQKGGAEQVTLTPNQIPAHSHNQQGKNGDGDETNPVPGCFVANDSDDHYAEELGAAGVVMGATTNAGGSQPHTNIQPYGTVNYIIALQGIFPS